MEVGSAWEGGGVSVFWGGVFPLKGVCMLGGVGLHGGDLHGFICPSSSCV